MNTQSNTMPNSFASSAAEPRAISVGQHFYWSVRRELWENRSLYLAPLGAAVLYVLGFLISLSHFAHRVRSAADPMLLHDHIEQPYTLAALLIMGSTLIVGWIYSLDALYGERRDRSILFWKSLPISDSATVLSKVISAVLIAPIAVVACGVLTGIVMLMMFAIALSFHGVSVWSLLALAHPFQVVGFLIGSIPLYLLWALPTVGWLMLCSSWARAKPFLWAVVIPVALGVMISWFNLLGSAGFKSSWYWRDIVARVLFSVFPGGWLRDTAAHQLDKDPQSIGHFFNLSNSYAVLATPDIWIGAAAGIAMLAGAVWFRRWRDDS